LPTCRGQGGRHSWRKSWDEQTVLKKKRKANFTLLEKAGMVEKRIEDDPGGQVKLV